MGQLITQPLDTSNYLYWVVFLCQVTSPCVGYMLWFWGSKFGWHLWTWQSLVLQEWLHLATQNVMSRFTVTPPFRYLISSSHLCLSHLLFSPIDKMKKKKTKRMSVCIFLINWKASLHSASLLKHCLLVFSEKSLFSFLVTFLKISSLWKQSIINTSEKFSYYR